MKYLVISLALFSVMLSIENPQNVKLGEITKSASYLESDISKIPGNITIIQKDDIQKGAHTTLSDTIRKLGGTHIVNDTGFNPRPSINIRGIKYGTLVMLDGVILSDLEGENRILNQISLYDVARIEVSRGSFSSLYGTNAFGGMINFITDMPRKLEVRAISSYGNELKSGDGIKDSMKLYGSIGDSILDNKLRYKISAASTTQSYPYTFPSFGENNATSYNTLSGYEIDKTGKYIIGDGGRRVTNTYDIRAKAELDIGESDTLKSMITLSNHKYYYTDQKTYLTDNSGNPTYLVNGKDYFVGSGIGGLGTYTHLLGNVGWEHYFGDDSTLSINLSSLNLFSQWQDALSGVGTQSGGAGSTQDITTTSNFLDILYKKPYMAHVLNIGASMRYYELEVLQQYMSNWRDSSTRYGDGYRGYGNKAFVGSGMLNLNSTFGDLVSDIGVRYDYWQNYDGFAYGTLDGNKAEENVQNRSLSKISPKLSLNYNLEGFGILKSSIGYGFRNPTMREAYQSTHGTTYWQINQNIKPESAISFEIGGDFTSSDIFQAKAYYFHSEVKDIIYRQGQGIQSNPYKSVNAGGGRIHGVELEAQVRLASHLFLGSNYTLTRAIITKNDVNPATINKQLNAIPLHHLNVYLDYKKPYGFYGSIWGHYTPAFYSDDLNSTPLSNTYGHYDNQFVINTKIGYSGRNGVDVSFSINNLTNNRYYDFYKVSGITLYGTLAIKI